MTKMMIETGADLSAQVRIEFLRDQDRYPDRWMHRIVLVSADQAVVILESVEGDDQTIWPPSPPLQDPDRHELPQGDAVLAVGMAGKSHWSASVLVSNNRQIVFDMACLVKATGGWVGSTYRLTDSVSPEMAYVTDGTLTIQHPLGKLKLQCAADADCSSTITTTDSQYSIAPCAPVERSVRWKYTIGVEA